MRLVAEMKCGDGHALSLQSGRIEPAFLAQGIMAARQNKRGRDVLKAGCAQGRRSPVMALGRIGNIVIDEIAHPGERQRDARGGALKARIDRREVNGRIKQELIPDTREIPVPCHKRNHGS